MDEISKKEQLQQLAEIRSLMERSSRFISLSGMSGIGAGISALIGAAAAYWRISLYSARGGGIYRNSVDSLMWELILIATIVLVVALSLGTFFTLREAKKQGQSLWDTSSKQLVSNLLIPLVTGGAFCLILIYHGMLWMVAPASLIFYGLALVNASKYTLNDIRYLGFCEIVLGLLNGIWMDAGNGILFWTIGFGIMHIVYGVFMHFKYNK
jgi:uncharacterized protein YjeT (DUF2065 family)